MIKAAINGGRTRSQHSAVPVRPDQLARDARDCLDAGAGAVHLHVRSSHDTVRPENESLHPADVARNLTPVLKLCAASQIGVSTGLWILPDVAKRAEAVSAWEVLPGFASVNFSEEGAAELAEILLSRGVDVEAGLCGGNDAEVFVSSGLANKCLRVLLEPQEQTFEAAIASVDQMVNLLDRTNVRLPRLLHGTEATSWPMLDEAIRRGYDMRIGFEDTLVLSDGVIAQSNVQLLYHALERIMYE